jgi:hypothetical protein
VGVVLGLATKPPRRLLAVVIAFGAGVLVSALTFDLMGEAFERETGAYRPSRASWPTLPTPSGEEPVHALSLGHQPGDDGADRDSEAKKIPLSVPGHDVAEKHHRKDRDDQTDQLSLQVTDVLDQQPPGPGHRAVAEELV